MHDGLKLLGKPWFFTVKGNHEQMLIDAYRANPHLPYRQLLREGIKRGRRPHSGHAHVIMTLNLELHELAEHLDIRLTEPQRVGMALVSIIDGEAMYQTRSAFPVPKSAGRPNLPQFALYHVCENDAGNISMSSLGRGNNELAEMLGNSA